MKEGWKMVKLGEVSYIYDKLRKPVTKRDRKQGIYPYYGATGIQDYVDSYIFDGRYLLLGEDGAKWGAGDSSAFIIEGKVWVNNHAHILQFKEDVYDRFVMYYLNWSDLSHYITGATVPKLTQASMLSIPIPLPPLPEQRRLVSLLDAAFEKIDALKTNAEQNLINAKALFQQTLAQELKPKEGWVEKKLGEVCEITSTLVDPREDKYKKLLHVGGANILSETGEIGNLVTAEEEGLESSKFTFDNTMVLYNKIRPYLKKVARPNFAGLCSADMYPLYPKPSFSKDFLYYILLSEDFTNYAILNSGRAGMPKVNRASLFAYCFSYPPSLEEQTRIVTTLDALSEKCRRLEEIAKQTVAECDALKQSILRQAFSGQL